MNSAESPPKNPGSAHSRRAQSLRERFRGDGTGCPTCGGSGAVWCEGIGIGTEVSDELASDWELYAKSIIDNCPDCKGTGWRGKD